MQRHQALRHGHLGKMADAPQVVRLRQSHDAAAMRLGTFNRHLHGLLAHHLTIAALPVQRQHAADVCRHAGRGIGLEATFEHGIHIARQHAHAVRVVAAQVGHHQVGGYRIGLCG